MLRLIVSDKAGQQTNFDFNKTEITVGRMKGNDIVLPKGNVSKKHATIYTQNGQFFINDHNSTNGSYINGQRINGVVTINEEDKVFIGDFIIQVDRSATTSGVQPPLPPVPGNGGFDQPSSLPPLPPTDMDVQGGNREGFETLFDSPDLSNSQDPRSTFVSPPDDVSADLRRTAANIPQDGLDTADSAVSQHSTPGMQQPVQPAPIPVAPPTPPAPQQTVSHTSKPNLPTINPTAYIAEQPEMISAFDADFFVAQLDGFATILDQIPLGDWARQLPVDDETLQAYSDAVNSAVDAVEEDVDKDKLKEVLLAEMTGLGVLDRYMDDEDVSEIFINKYDNILLKDKNALIQAPHVFSNPDVLNLIAERLLGEDASLLGADELRYGDGTRVHVVMPPMAVNGPLITVRKPSQQRPSLTDLIEQNVLSAGMADFLMRAVDASQSIIICGPTSSGKSTLLSALGTLIHDGVRVITVEDFSQLDLPQSSAVKLEANPNAGFDKSFLLRSALSMHPERLILDECKGAEAYDWTTAVASGTEGNMATTHGINAHDALSRLESLCYLGATGISPRGLKTQIARSVDLIVTVNRAKNNTFRVQQIAEVNGVDFDAYRINDIFYHRAAPDSDGFHPTGYIPAFYEDLQHAGVDVDFDIFRE